MKNITEIKTTLIGIALIWLAYMFYTQVENHNEVNPLGFQAIIIYALLLLGFITVVAKDRHLDSFFGIFKDIMTSMISEKFVTYFARFVGVATVLVTFLYWMGILILPHPEWTNMTIRIGLPMLIGWVLIIFDITTIKGFILKFITKKWL
jgi:hypothetical protein